MKLNPNTYLKKVAWKHTQLLFAVGKLENVSGWVNKSPTKTWRFLLLQQRRQRRRRRRLQHPWERRRRQQCSVSSSGDRLRALLGG